MLSKNVDELFFSAEAGKDPVDTSSMRSFCVGIRTFCILCCELAASRAVDRNAEIENKNTAIVASVTKFMMIAGTVLPVAQDHTLP
jgi:hypothetical protein